MYKIALIALVMCVAFANLHKHQQSADTHQVLTEISKDEFGSMILNAIQTQIQAKAPADEVQLLFNSLLQGLSENQDVADNLNSTNQAACSRITLDLDNSVVYHQTQVDSNTQLRDDSTEQLEQAEIDVRQTTQDIQNNEDTQASEQSTREEQNAVFNGKQAQNNDAVEAIDEAIKLMQHLQLGASFAQVKPRYEGIQKKLQALTSHETLFKPIIAAFAELATNVDNKALVAISKLLAQIRQQLVEALIVLTATEERQAAHYVEFSEHLTNEHQRLVERKQQLEASISLNKNNIESAEEYIEYHSVELENVEDALENQEDWCESQSNNYEEQSTLSAQQQELILRIQEHVTEHLSASEQFLAGRSD